MNRKITAPKGAKIYYFGWEGPGVGEVKSIPDQVRELLELEMAGQDYLLEIRSGKKEDLSGGRLNPTAQICWEFIWQLEAFEHTRKYRQVADLQHILLPWYLCVEYQDCKYALYRMDDGDTQSVSARRRAAQPDRWGGGSP